MIKTSGYQDTFFWFGVAQGAVILLFSLFMHPPEVDEVPKSAFIAQSVRDFRPSEVLKTPVFWVMYAMFVAVAAGDLMATAQLAPIANDYKIATVPVSIAGLTLPALTFALSLDRILNGITRPLFGWVSDHIGR